MAARHFWIAVTLALNAQIVVPAHGAEKPEEETPHGSLRGVVLDRAMR
jgi:hypothetical protein